MEEGKRTLWIIAAVGVFLSVVTGTALLLYTPRSKNASAAPVSPQAVSGIGTIPPPPLPRPTEPRPVGAEGIGSPLNESAQQQPNAVLPQKANDVTVYAENAHVYGSSTTIDLNALKSVPASVTPENEAARKAVAAAAEKKAAEVKRAAESAQNTAQNAAKLPAAKPTKPAPTPAPKAKTAAGKEYWVQAASFTVRKNAESALAVLAENKLQGEIFTHIDATGKTFYRVRVGPYATETEAKSWQERIALIDQFAKATTFVSAAR
ncbi:SPOR domain-containing protein [Treponema endosymbiont of Eucomonympha sp.]|uniref:SPOR domain-containing protein n=2 Tax=Treponema endosymbiont of Eucomonympha sp. TaxID=1580831 RepID=UPI000781A227|nr:SPOR domain-containing protein [Treponema endosymbiont of Eucomonympha sp.]